MFFSLVVVSLLLFAGKAAGHHDLDPDVEGEDEMGIAVVSSILDFT